MESDPAKVAEVALSLFERRGYAQVTMSDVAKAARVSRRTLFRHFPAKADLAWAGVAEALEYASRLLEKLPRDRVNVRVVLRGALEPVMERFSTRAATPLARRRLRIIASSPELVQHGSLERVQQQLALVLGHGKVTPRALLAARSVVHVGFGAMLWWAEHGGRMTPLEATREAFRALR